MVETKDPEKEKDIFLCLRKGGLFSIYSTLSWKLFKLLVRVKKPFH